MTSLLYIYVFGIGVILSTAYSVLRQQKHKWTWNIVLATFMWPLIILVLTGFVIIYVEMMDDDE